MSSDAEQTKGKVVLMAMRLDDEEDLGIGLWALGIGRGGWWKRDAPGSQRSSGIIDALCITVVLWYRDICKYACRVLSLIYLICLLIWMEKGTCCVRAYAHTSFPWRNALTIVTLSVRIAK